MQAQNNKKKSRQRSRPKNKANRLNENQELKNSNGEIEEKKNFPSTAQNQLVTQTLYDSNETIRFMQQKMRTHFLKQQRYKQQQQKETQQVKDDPNLHLLQKNLSGSHANDPTVEPNLDEKNSFIESQILVNGNLDLQQTIFSNLQKLLDQAPVSDIESSDDEDEYVEYVYKPRQYFLTSLCNFCFLDLSKNNGNTIKRMPCKRCHLTYYCCMDHMRKDEKHHQLCYALRQIAENNDNHIFNKCSDFSNEQFRSYRIVTIRKAEAIINRPLTATEQEIILFPRICMDAHCREYRFNRLNDCAKCGQVAYCCSKAAHFSKTHYRWCKAYHLFKELIIFQVKFGRLDPSLPTKILKDLPAACCNTKQILRKLNFDVKDQCEYAALSQISTGPLTAWYSLRICMGLKKSNGTLTIHLIGAELEFEVDTLHKWEVFFMHIAPAIKELNIIFIGPELNPRKISFEQLKKTKCCRVCRKAERKVNYYFDCNMYHAYCDSSNFIQPDLICFFNPGLYRATGYQLQDTWPETILAAAKLKCPVVVTSYTEYEAPLDMTRFVQECNRHLNVVLPPILNPFASEKPERNFVSDDEAPLMFKNYYSFLLE